jgi:hypothetical protein
MTTNPEKCPRPLDLVKYFLEGGATSSPESTIEDHVRGCAACQAQIRELAAERKAFLVNHPFSSFWEKLEESRSKRSFGLASALKHIFSSGTFRAAVAMVGVAALMIVVIGRYDRSPQIQPEILSKGGVDLRFYVAAPNGGEPAPGKNGMTLPPESSLQFVYSASPQESQLLLIGVEENGSLTVYFPSGGDQSAPIASGDQKKMPQALRWKPAANSSFERFYAVFSKTPVAVDEIRKALDLLKASGKSVEQTATLPLPYPQASAVIYKKPS